MVHNKAFGNHVITLSPAHRYSLGRSNLAMAALVCALYPKFPLTSTDNRYHLQAFRHLYTLAAEPRVLVTRDVRTGQTCSVDVHILTDGGKVVETCAPCIVPEWSLIRKVCGAVVNLMMFLKCIPYYGCRAVDYKLKCACCRSVCHTSLSMMLK